MPFPAEPVAGSLQYQLDEITANTRALVPPERLARAEQLVADLHASRVEERILAPGTQAPEFALKAANGKLVRSSDLLALGPLVLKFFRGRWDPYDMTELEAWQALQPTLRQRRSLFVAVSPQIERQNAFTADRHHLAFPILSDPGCKVAESFGLAYSVPEAHQSYFRSILVNVPFLNGDGSWRLPLPATYILDESGKVVFAEAFADHRVRPEPARVLSVLEAVSRTGISD